MSSKAHGRIYRANTRAFQLAQVRWIAASRQFVNWRRHRSGSERGLNCLCTFAKVFEKRMSRHLEIATFVALVLIATGCKTSGLAPDRTALQPSIPAQGVQSEWRPLYDGTFRDFRIYFRGQGFIDDVNAQEVFVAEPEQIHVREGTNGLIVTRTEYSHYHVRVQYRWGGPGGSKNGGLMIHVDPESKVQNDNRPRSIEINMYADSPGSILLADKLGPFGSSFIEPGTKNYLPKDLGGELHHFNPFSDRMFFARYKDGQMPTKPAGEWNTMEAIVNGAESLQILINGQVVNRLHNIRLAVPDEQLVGVPNTRGAIGLQSEQQEIFYRNFEIRDLDSAAR